MENKKYSIGEIASAFRTRRCLNCKEDIDKSFNYKYKWNLPLCKKCRKKELDEMMKEDLKHK